MVKALKDWFKFIDEIREPKFDLNSLYSMTKHGKVLNDDQMKDEVIKYVKDQILGKVMSKQYTLVLDLVGDIAKYEQDIITYFSDLGLTAQRISVLLSKTGKTVEYILITWAK